MVKKIALLLFINWFSNSHSQVGIGTTNPNNSSSLDIFSNTTGLLIPRVSLIDVSNDSVPISSPATSLLVYNTNETTTNGSGSGYYYWNGSQWTKLYTTIDQDWVRNSLGQMHPKNPTDKVGIGTNNPMAKLHVNDGDVVFSAAGTGPNTEPINNPPVSGEGRRMMWYPEKTAFRTGYVSANQWDKDNIGFYSFAGGYNTKASGISSFSFGAINEAIGNYSLVFGSGSYSEDYSFSFGQNCATGIGYSFAFGKNASSGLHSLSFGENTIANNYSLAFGSATEALGTLCVSIGTENEIDIDTNYSFAFGANNYLNNTDYSVAFGQLNQIGFLSKHNFIVGKENVTGHNNHTTIFGKSNNIGWNADYSTIFGLGNRTNKAYCFVTGRYNTNYDAASNAIFIVGNGSSDTYRSNAFTVLENGNTGIGNLLPNEKLEVDGKTKTTELQVTNGANAGDVLTSDNFGNATWQTPAIQANYWTITGNNISNNNSDNVGIGTPNPTTKLEVNGFTKLGNDAPAIKVKKLTGTTSNVQDGQISINHGLNINKILSVSVSVVSNGFLVPASYSRNGYEFDFYINTSSISIWNTLSNSSNILSKPCTILITYEE